MALIDQLSMSGPPVDMESPKAAKDEGYFKFNKSVGTCRPFTEKTKTVHDITRAARWTNSHECLTLLRIDVRISLSWFFSG